MSDKPGVVGDSSFGWPRKLFQCKRGHTHENAVHYIAPAQTLDEEKHHEKRFFFTFCWICLGEWIKEQGFDMHEVEAEEVDGFLVPKRK